MLLRLCVLLALGLLLQSAQAASSNQYCARHEQVDVAAVDHMLQLGAVLEQQLDRAGARVALISRAGLDLSRFGLRYSHAGLALRSPEGWAVRQLYFDCDSGQPRIFDQGLPGFALGNEQDDPAFISVVLLSGERADSLAARTTDNTGALNLLGGDYSANAYAFSTQYQNCNQWVAELMAQAWGKLPLTPTPEQTRGLAQAWLQQAGYQPTLISSDNPFVIIASWFMPFLHRSDHPPGNREQNRFMVSMPASLEAFVRDQDPEAARLELCYRDSRIVIRKGWHALDASCTPGPQDEVQALRHSPST
ncbi:MAG: hypothetical protein CGU28_09645 [Candidatus Dactylopiibacterium carminicum]|uniref:DUF2145 domain-containing protein n=1 Tax=Candidatus Dactylopiibacterium carminicum TaxID=857335 RepID=A0A272ERP5_9RHOO|nr:DUF2145 domain-containing protein [Candidatus Dactylopiibacterium carminicum]KAF7598848.1 DUF2145 domain-containing protein [Candidatus Dactylopiibacterium carminicum]PAS92764.1 MAG: hypothetical protein CGU29_10235 [Candidatus Dactylopiibacterium carminicum]PAS96214.1 MAG: hypothetical protein CGU28_09645 [Candidatus Dactylopiibacterium carminicum]PAS98866.1 MAG: hypothetical protein BSR46_10995 [Candidatus Dactylopiibacterium carminicum]